MRTHYERELSVRERDREREKNRSSLRVSGSWATITDDYYILVFIGVFYLGLWRFIYLFIFILGKF